MLSFNLQLLDFITTALAVLAVGPDGEANPVMQTWIGLVGVPGFAVVKISFGWWLSTLALPRWVILLLIFPVAWNSFWLAVWLSS